MKAGWLHRNGKKGIILTEIALQIFDSLKDMVNNHVSQVIVVPNQPLGNISNSTKSSIQNTVLVL